MMVHKKEKGMAGDEKGEKIGGFAAEYKGHAMPEVAEKELESSLQGGVGACSRQLLCNSIAVQ